MNNPENLISQINLIKKWMMLLWKYESVNCKILVSLNHVPMKSIDLVNNCTGIIRISAFYKTNKTRNKQIKKNILTGSGNAERWHAAAVGIDQVAGQVVIRAWNLDWASSWAKSVVVAHHPGDAGVRTLATPRVDLMKMESYIVREPSKITY
jgi:hypothetical protein